jgi:hypothetical protein
MGLWSSHFGNQLGKFKGIAGPQSENALRLQFGSCLSSEGHAEQSGSQRLDQLGLLGFPTSFLSFACLSQLRSVRFLICSLIALGPHEKLQRDEVAIALTSHCNGLGRKQPAGQGVVEQEGQRRGQLLK